ncbi:MAG: tRNA (guanosine(46)-N7)-methyltransferase TrmB [Candidatus Sumerlaeia bacterium]|nr:tRNA (guanosine(46)-N7)-methyltransferase TrmB [Candidatus Sumerlaeia bacterium]
MTENLNQFSEVLDNEGEAPEAEVYSRRGRAKVEEAPIQGWLLNLSEFEKPLDWEKVFGNRNPVEVEIGCGTGLFLAAYAKDHPELNLVGLDKVAGIVLRTAQKLRKRQLNHVRVLRFEALYFLEEYIAPESLNAVHCYYSDPWPKRSHHRRRVWQPPFLKAAHRSLKPGGLLYMKTDVTDYFEAIQKAFGQCSELFECVEQHRLDEVPLPGDYDSNFQQKARVKGHPLYYQIWRKR